MTDQTRAVLARVAEFLAGLSAADLAALAEGRARLAVVPAAGVAAPADGPGVLPATAAAMPAGRTGPPGRATASRGTGSASPGTRSAGRSDAGAARSGGDAERAHAALAAMTRREEGTAYLSSWTTRELRALAARAGLRGVAGLRKMELVERIVDRTIGFRLDSTAIRRR